MSHLERLYKAWTLLSWHIFLYLNDDIVVGPIADERWAAQIRRRQEHGDDRKQFHFNWHC